MAMRDAYIAQGAPSVGAERELVGRISGRRPKREGARPGFERARALARVFVHRHETCVTGVPAPRCYFVPVGFPRASPTTSGPW
jgi:hypothetical protein